MYTGVFSQHVDQGVILHDVYFYSSDAKHYGLVLTPTCDFAHDKVEAVQLCALRPAWDVIRDLLSDEWASLNPPSSSGKIKDLRSRIESIVKNKLPRYHWFAPLPNTEVPLIGDFQYITSLQFEEAKNLGIVAELVSPYREQVPARYAAYMGRVGTPDYETASVESWINTSMMVLFPSSQVGTSKPAN